MQLGTRWSVGATPPEKVPAEVVAAVRTTEAELESLGSDTAMWRWTLTWLEGRPVVQLDDGTTIRVGHDGTVAVTAE